MTQACRTVNGGTTWTPSSSAGLVSALQAGGGTNADGACGKDSSILSCINFDFSGISSGVNISSISATVSAKGSSTLVDMDTFCFTLNGAGQFGTNSPNTMTTSFADYTITETTGFTLNDIVNNSNFGVLIGGTNNGPDTKDLYIDSLSVTVTYTGGTATITFGRKMSSSQIFDSKILSTEDFPKC